VGVDGGGRGGPGSCALVACRQRSARPTLPTQRRCHGVSTARRL
jgi:hypothetical protein